MPSKIADEQDIDDEPPTSINPYKVLDVPEDATDEAIKKAYRREALAHHPDKAAECNKTAAKEKFQQIAFAYAILSEPRRRKRYDTTGSTAETLDLEDDDFDWLTFYREQFENVINEEAISAHKSTYQGSEEEREAILKAYKLAKGNMTKIYHQVMHSEVLEDDDRIRRIIDEAIASGEIPAYDEYTAETEQSKERRKKSAQREAKEALAEKQRLDDEKKKKGKGKGKGGAKDGDASLAALIQQRQKGRETAFFEHLEEKYGAKSKGKKRGSAHMDEPPEEAFAATAARGKKSRK